MVFNGHEDISSSVHSFSKQFLSARGAGIYALSLERETSKEQIRQKSLPSRSSLEGNGMLRKLKMEAPIV